MRTPEERAALSMVAMAELALLRRQQAVFARLREAAEIDPELTAKLLDHASSTILEEVARAASSRPVGRHGGVQRTQAGSPRPVAPALAQTEKDPVR